MRCLVEASRAAAAVPDRALVMASRTSGAIEAAREGGPEGYPTGTDSNRGFMVGGAGDGSYIGLVAISRPQPGVGATIISNTCSSPFLVDLPLRA